jgi:glycosyltransferase involved in cell wall biosynthesis
MSPQFSILVPTYNQADYLIEALDSLLAQTVQDWEAIVVNDGSTDHTAEVLARYTAKEPRIKAVTQPNGGTAAALNRALVEARGTWICWLSSDDLFMPDKLTVHQRWFARCPDTLFFFTYFQLRIEATGQVFDKHGLWGPLPQRRYQTLGLFKRNFVSGISICVHRTVFEELGGFSQDLRYGQDYDRWLWISSRYPGVFIPEWTCVNRNHAAQGSEVFPQACYYDTAKAGIQFLQTVSFEEMLPLCDLSRPDAAYEALREALRIAVDADAFLYWLGVTPGLLFNCLDWISRYPDAEIRSCLWHVAEDRLTDALACAPEGGFAHLLRIGLLAAILMPERIERGGIDAVWAGRQMYGELVAAEDTRKLPLERYFRDFMKAGLFPVDPQCIGRSIVVACAPHEISWVLGLAQTWVRYGASVLILSEGANILDYAEGVYVLHSPAAHTMPEALSRVGFAIGLHTGSVSLPVRAQFVRRITEQDIMPFCINTVGPNPSVATDNWRAGVKKMLPEPLRWPLKKLLVVIQQCLDMAHNKGRAMLDRLASGLKKCMGKALTLIPPHHLAYAVDKACPGNIGHTAFAKRGLHLLRHHFYLPLPMEEDLSSEFLESRSELVGLELHAPEMWELAEITLWPYFKEFAVFPERSPSADYHGFYLINGGYMAVDGHLYYSLVRHLKPRRIVETGCGMSSLLCSTALARNEEEGAQPCVYTCIEPYPQPYLLQNPLMKVNDLRVEKIQNTPLAIFEELEAGDILFIDTSHALRMGGDVQQIYCEILPRLKPGVHVHVHDISLPCQYPRTYHEDMQYFWNEQYILQAYLTNNAKARIAWAGNWLRLQDESRFDRAFPEFKVMRKDFPQSEPTAFWFVTC